MNFPHDPDEKVGCAEQRIEVFSRMILAVAQDFNIATTPVANHRTMGFSYSMPEVNVTVDCTPSGLQINDAQGVHNFTQESDLRSYFAHRILAERFRLGPTPTRLA